ncbi:hypothetical protein Tco_0034752 [Tanacetum coccineum]
MFQRRNTCGSGQNNGDLAKELEDRATQPIIVAMPNVIAQVTANLIAIQRNLNEGAGSNQNGSKEANQGLGKNRRYAGEHPKCGNFKLHHLERCPSPYHLRDKCPILIRDHANCTKGQWRPIQRMATPGKAEGNERGPSKTTSMYLYFG